MSGHETSEEYNNKIQAKVRNRKKGRKLNFHGEY